MGAASDRTEVAVGLREVDPGVVPVDDGAGVRVGVRVGAGVVDGAVTGCTGATLGGGLVATVLWSEKDHPSNPPWMASWLIGPLLL